MKRGLLIGGAVIVVLAAVGLWYVLSSLDAIVEAAIEEYGSEITGTAVRVGSVQIELTSGKGTIRDLTIANPPGFSSSDAFTLSEITLQIDPATITSDPVVIPQVVVREPKVSFEVAANGKTNLSTIQANVDRYAASSGGSASEASESESSETRLLIRKFSFTGGEVHADTEAVGGKSMTEKIPAVNLSNVGAPNGATPDVIGQTIAGAFVQRVVTAVSQSQLKGLLSDKLGGDSGSLVEGAGSAAKKLFGK